MAKVLCNSSSDLTVREKSPQWMTAWHQFTQKSLNKRNGADCNSDISQRKKHCWMIKLQLRKAKILFHSSELNFAILANTQKGLILNVHFWYLFSGMLKNYKRQEPQLMFPHRYCVISVHDKLHSANFDLLPNSRRATTYQAQFSKTLLCWFTYRTVGWMV